MASCEVFSCSCNDDTCPSRVVRAAINGATSGSVGCGRLVRRLNVTPVLVSDDTGTTGAAGTTGSTGSSAGVTLSGAASFTVEGATGSGTTAGLLLESPPFMERVLKSSLVAAVSNSSSRVRYVISAPAEGPTVIVGILSISTPDDADSYA